MQTVQSNKYADMARRAVSGARQLCHFPTPRKTGGFERISISICKVLANACFPDLSNNEARTKSAMCLQGA